MAIANRQPSPEPARYGSYHTTRRDAKRIDKDFPTVLISTPTGPVSKTDIVGSFLVTEFLGFFGGYSYGGGTSRSRFAVGGRRAVTGTVISYFGVSYVGYWTHTEIVISTALVSHVSDVLTCCEASMLGPYDWDDRTNNSAPLRSPTDPGILGPYAYPYQAIRRYEYLYEYVYSYFGLIPNMWRKSG